MKTNSTPCSSFSSSSSDSSTKMSKNSFLQPNRAITKKSTENRIMKHHIAPLPKIPPKIYKVEKKYFKNMVQRLTGPQPADDSQPIRRLKDLAPPPLDLSTAVKPGTAVDQVETFLFPDGDDTEIMGHVEFDNNQIDDYFKNLETLIKISSPKLLTPSCGSKRLGGLLSPFSLSPAFTLSPASISWCSLFLSPGTLSTLDQSIFQQGR